MSELDRLAHLLVESGDAENPSPEALRDLVQRLRSIAVVGISRDPMKPARRVPSYLAAKGIEVLPVNPEARWLLGRPCRSTLSAVVEPVDLVLIFRPGSEAREVMHAAAARPEAPCVWLQRGIRNDAAAREIRSLKRGAVVQNLCLFEAHRALDQNLPRPLVGRAF
jgi:predicted CoA-binding protein